MGVKSKLKLTVNQSLDIKENEIIINCSVMDDRLKKLVDMIRQYSFSLKATAEGERYNVPLENIIYIDSVDGKTFLYCTDKVYEYKETLMSLELTLHHTSFVRISKNCIMNVNSLKSVHTSFNHRMEATMTNGEKLIVSRNYIDNLKKKLDE
jgi:DNA-binding LytR/AlgR family response regulator